MTCVWTVDAIPVAVYVVLTSVVNDLSFSESGAWMSCIGLTLVHGTLCSVILCVAYHPTETLRDQRFSVESLIQSVDQ